MKLKLHTQILISIVLGVFIGIAFKDYVHYLVPVGEIFIRLLKMVIVPLVFASMVKGIVSLGNVRSLGKMGGRTFFYYLSTTVLAVITGLVFVNLIKPGVGVSLPQGIDPLPLIPEESMVSFSSILTSVVPHNIVQSLASSHMLSVIFFSVILGCALLVVGRKGDAMVSFIDSLNEVMLQITHWVIRLAPIGVCALMAVMVGQMGISAFRPVALYMFTVAIGLLFHFVFSLGGILLFVGRFPPVLFVKKMFPAIATAFSTDSSLATLPVTMDCLERRVGVSNKVSGFVSPLGATINMDGTALYEAVAAMFVAQLYGIDLSLTQQILISVTATLASIGAAGVPSAGVTTLVIVLQSVNLPLHSIGLILAVDRILDMLRTTVNIFGDAVGSLVVATLEGERIPKE